MQNIRIKSPATTANLGPGYDCLGMALDLWNELEVTVLKSNDIHIDIKQRFGSIKHQYSHFNINLIGYCCDYKKGRAKPLSSDEIKWITLKQIKNFAFPKSTLKLFNLYENNYRNNT